MNDTFWAPREFFESTYVPHICLVYGTREDIVFRPVNIAGAALFDMPTVPLPMSPRAIPNANPWRDVLGLTVVAATWYAVDALLTRLFPAAANLIFYGGLPLLMLGYMLAYLLFRSGLPGSRPRFRWVELEGVQGVQITFPARWAQVQLEFDRALKQWLARPRHQTSAVPPPPDDYQPEPATTDEDFPDSQGADWDEAKAP